MQVSVLTHNLPLVIGGTFVAVLFLQSGIDKVTDWGGNLAFLKDHFSKTFLAGLVPPMLGTITLAELATGLLAAAGVVYLLITGSPLFIWYASVVGAASLTALFFGQRVAKDYAGAAVLVPYFILMLALMFLSDASGRSLQP